MTSEEIQNANVGEAVEHNSTIHLEEYDPNWPSLFETQREVIIRALRGLEFKIEHVGSTSVPGLAAKPIIDIVLEVPDSSKEEKYVPHLEANGFKLKIREPEWFEHRVLKGNTIPTNLHVFSLGCSEVTKMKKFRDHLKENRDDFDKYLNKKRSLAARQWKYVQNYADAKSEVIADITKRIR